MRNDHPHLHLPRAKKTASLRDTPDEDLQEALNEWTKNNFNIYATARAMGVSVGTIRYRLGAAERKQLTPTIRGRSEAQKPRTLKLPKRGKVSRYILTCAQNDTFLDDQTWDALQALAKHYDATVMVSTLTYLHSLEGSAKRGTARVVKDSMWYDPRIEPFVSDEMVELAPGLVWNGNTNITPTAVEPLSGYDNYNFRASSIFPHVKVAMKSVPTVRQDAAKLQFTTGTVTKRNYIQKKAGQKAEFDHVYGGLLVEVNSSGDWWVRQLSVDSDGGLYDLDLYVATDGTITKHSGVEALQFGDIHVAQMEQDQLKATWAPGGMVDALKPKYQFMHDLLDFESRSHHNMRDPFKMFELHARGRESVRRELEEVAHFLTLTTHCHPSEIVVVQSNHDEHFERWLRDTSWKSDPINAELHSAATMAWLAAIREGTGFNALRWGLAHVGAEPEVLTWADPDAGFVILKDHTGGVEMGLHGDKGPNGSRGSLRNLSRIGRKVCIGHAHAAGIINGAYQSGVKAKLGMDYAKGSPSSWSQSDIVVYPNAKRTIVTWWGSKYRA